MKSRHVALAALFLATGWSTNVVYEYNTGENLLRSIASVEVKLSADTIQDEVSKLSVTLERLKNTKSDLSKNIASSSSVKDLISLRNEDLASALEQEKEFNKHKARINEFVTRGEKARSAELEAKLTDLNKESSLIKMDEEKLKLKAKLSDALEAQAAEQEEVMNNLQSSLCKQNEEISSLGKKLDQLLADKREILDEVNPPSVFQGMNFPYAMTPLTFFQQQPQMPIVNQQNPMGIDYNFLMLTQMLSSTMSLGPKPAINYAPTYNQNQSYFGMPQSYNLSDEAQFNTGSQMLLGSPQSNRPQLRGPLTGIESGFNFVPSFTRNPANAIEIPLAQ
jgi:uncharacterized coiled-coil protein SlyX